MSLQTFGVNHKTAPIAVRERLAFAVERLPEALHHLVHTGEVPAAAILSTCNRTEFYCGGAEVEPIIDWLVDYRALPAQALEHSYHYTNESAVQHAMRVASGLDSMVLGEPQILGQMKKAYAIACDAGTVNKPLGRLFQQAFTVAKQVRTHTGIGASPVSIAFAAVKLAKHIFSDFSQVNALLIGGGQTIELAARHLLDNAVQHVTIANRTVARAQYLARELGVQAMGLTEVAEVLAKVDVVISATGSSLPVLGKGTVERALKERRRRPMFMVDVAVPRDIEPEVAELEDVYLYCVDDLQSVIEENKRSRETAAQQAEEMITSQSADFMAWLRLQDDVSTLCEFRHMIEHQRDYVLEKALRALRRGREPEAVLQQLAHGLTNRFLHEPTTRLHRAGLQGQDDVAKWVRDLFNMKS